tara:strand:+ start:4428 stop:5462 length:1035 start_codon:yes stop_codon:yes gene_type:complete
MFKFFKDKLKDTVDKFSSKVEESIEEEKTEEQEEVIEEKTEKIKEKEPEEDLIEKKSLAQRLKEKITTKKISEIKFDELFQDLEILMLENNVALEVIDKIRSDLKMDIVDHAIERNKINQTIKSKLKESVQDLFETPFDLIDEIKDSKKPYVIVLLGVNGGGKTTTTAKLANLFKKNNLSSVLVAADTFRAAAIQQLEEWGEKIDTRVIKHDYGSDPSAVAFDGIKHAEAKKIDVVLIDTAGRLHSSINLMDEIKKLIRVTNPNLKIFIGESIVGNDCVEQAKRFNEAVNINGIILTKADIDEKGGAAISVSYVTKKPILYLGMGQSQDDLKEFNSKEILEMLF